MTVFRGHCWMIQKVHQPLLFHILFQWTKYLLKQLEEIRVVVFSDQTNLSISFSITKLTNNEKVSSGHLRFSRHLIKGRSLYTFPLKDCITEDGKYRITFSEYFDGSSEFVISSSIEFKMNNYGGRYSRMQTIIIYLFPFFFVFLMFVVLFIPFNFCGCQNKLDLVEEWIETSNTNSSYWLLTIFGGFVLVRTRFLNIPKAIQIFVLICVFWSIAGPINIFQTENLVGFIWIYGYVIDNKVLPSDYGAAYAFFYLTFTCMPMILVCSSLGVKSWSLYQIGDFIIAVGLMAADVYIIIRCVHESVGPKFTAASIGFVLLPIVFIMVFCVWMVAFKKKKLKCGNNFVNDNDNDNSSMNQNLNSSPSQPL